MGVITRAVRNISRRKIRSSLVVIALAFSLAIMISIPAGVVANQSSTISLAQNLGNTITQTEASINQTLTQIDCSLTPEFEGFGFGPSNSGNGGSFTPGQLPPGNFTPGQFGGGMGIPGMFGGGAFGQRGATPMNQSLYNDISSVSGVAAIAPILQVSEGEDVTMEMMGRTFTRQVTQYVIEGISLDSNLIETYPILPTNISAGRNLQTGDTGVVLLSENNTDYFGVEVGETVTILGESFEIIGTHGSTGVSDATTMYMSLSDVQSLTNNTGYITSISVFAESSDIVTEVADSISSLHPELSVATSQQRLNQLEAVKETYQTALDSAEASLATMQTTASGEIAVAIVATSLIVFFVMLYTVRERTKEIGTLKAIGFSNKSVMSQFIFEGVLLSLIAGVIGIAIGFVAAPMLSGLLLPAANELGIGGAGGRFIGASNTAATATLTPELILYGLGAAVLLGVLGSLYPAWRASRTRPAEAMRYE